MKFRARIKDARGSTWWEDFNDSEVTDEQTAQAASRSIVTRFNETLRPGELQRTLLAVSIGDGGAHEAHRFSKTNLVTIMERGRLYDALRCSRCGVTGKRFGVEGIRRDFQYKARAFEFCDTARTLLAKRAMKAKA